jgi:RNA polymerase sigma factor (sigma-70 family)
MAKPPLSTVLGHIRTLAGADGARELNDRHLLEQFAARKDEAAFAELMRRHGRLVWSVCRNVLGHDQDAEDAFQAVFVVLARRGVSVRKSEALASWLHGVAYRVAMKAKRSAARRRVHEHQVQRPAQTQPVPESAWRDLQAALDEEVQGLPDRLRGPFVLCCLEGKGPAYTARELGWKVSTVHTRVSEARQELLRRLARRGVSLSAAACAATLSREAAAAALPAALAKAAVGAALAAGAGKTAAVSAQVAALVEGGLRPMALCNARTLVTVVVAVSLACTGAGLWARGGLGSNAPLADAASTQAEQEPCADAAPQFAKQEKAAKDDKKIGVSGRVLDPEGKPVRGARVFVLDMPRRVIRSLEEFHMNLGGASESDAQGHFQLRVRSPGGEPPPSPVHPLPVILVRADGYGLGVHAVTTNASKEVMVIRLPREQVLRARFVDERGKPVKDLLVKVASVGQGFAGQGGGILMPPAQPPRAWFAAMKTDAEGRLQLRGLGPGQYVTVEWRDARFRSLRLELWRTEAQQGGQEVVCTLEPPVPEFISGRVTFHDTGKPAAGVSVRTRGDKTKTDRQGRFRLKTNWEDGATTLAGAVIAAAWVEVDAPAVTPYFGWRGHVGPGRIPQRDGTLGPYLPVDVSCALLRCVQIRGRVLEAGTNKGISGAHVCFLPGPKPANTSGAPPVGLTNPVSSGPDGAFSLMALPGSGHLIAAAAAAEYVPIQARVRWGAVFAHAVVPVDFKDDTGAMNLQIPMRRGAVVKGKLTGPDGQPVQGAVLISRLTTRAAILGWGEITSSPVSADFELRGCDPDKSYPVVIFQEQKGWGAVLQISGKQAAKPLDVRLQPCGAAKARYRTADGKPVAGRLTSGDVRMVLSASDSAFWGAFIEHSNARKDWHTDAQGYITWRNLVPGLTYRVNQRDFTVRPGEMLDLGDL